MNEKIALMRNPQEKIFVENLRALKEIFDARGITIWLDWGTLLGAIRERKIIAWDADIDLGIWGSEYEKMRTALPKFREKGFRVNELPIPNPEFSCTKFSFTRQGCVIDIYSYSYNEYTEKENAFVGFNADGVTGNFFERNFTKYLWLLWRSLCSAHMDTEDWAKRIMMRIHSYVARYLPGNWKRYLREKIKQWLIRKYNGTHIRRITVPKQYFEKLEAIEFYGMNLNVPSHTKDYLKRVYGKNWKIPTENWHWADSSFVGFLSLK